MECSRFAMEGPGSLEGFPAFVRLLLLGGVDDRLHFRLGGGKGAVDVASEDGGVGEARPRSVGAVDQIVELQRIGRLRDRYGLEADLHAWIEAF